MENMTIRKFNNGALEKQLEAIDKEFTKVKKSAWVVAKCYFNIVRGELFKDDFNSLSDFAEYMGTNKATVSRMVRAYEKRQQLQLNPDFSTATIIELLPIKEDEKIVDCIEKMNITIDDGQKVVREKVKTYLGKNETADETETEETAGETETTGFTFYFNNIEIVPNDDDIKKLAKILNKYLEQK